MSERAGTRSRKRRTIAVAAVALVVAVIAAVPVAGRIRQQAEVERGIAAAREFEGFPLYWVGERFEKWDLREVELPGRATYGFANLIYGNCEVDDPDGLFGPEGGSCTPPLAIQISPLCSHLHAAARAPIWKRRTIRGAPVGASGGAPVLFTRGAQVKVYRGQGSDRGVALRAVRAVRSLNSVAPVIAETGAIPAPDRRILAGERPCRDSRPGVTLIDENLGAYRGVGIGASADAVRRVLGARPFAGVDEPWSPTNARSFAEIGGPNVLTPPCRPTARRLGGGSRLKVLRYPDVSFVLCDGRVFALLVVDRQARTLTGLRLGDDLKDVRTLYPGIRCGDEPSGDRGRYPFCVARLNPRRSMWFGQDPVASITISTTRFGVDGER